VTDCNVNVQIVTVCLGSTVQGVRLYSICADCYSLAGFDSAGCQTVL
jgi:hypothetical protein